MTFTFITMNKNSHFIAADAPQAVAALMAVAHHKVTPH